jgi:hypothetical protein
MLFGPLVESTFVTGAVAVIMNWSEVISPLLAHSLGQEFSMTVAQTEISDFP